MRRQAKFTSNTGYGKLYRKVNVKLSFSIA